MTVPLWKNSQTRRFLGAQFASSLGDWIGLVAILALSFRLAEGTALAVYGPGFVLLTRTVPGFLFGQLAGPLVDRWDRKKVMVTCDIIRGLLIASLVFVPNLFLLILNQLVFELVTMLWQPAKEATVPDVVPEEQISQANSVGQLAAYGTFPLGALCFAGLSKLAQVLGQVPALKALDLNQEALALFVDSGTFFLAAGLIAGLHVPRREHPRRKLDFTLALREVRDGYAFITRHPDIRTVIFGMSTAVFGAGAVVSLGASYVTHDLNAGASGFGVMMTALGSGAALGVLTVETVGRRLKREHVYANAILFAGVALFLGASVSTMQVALLFIFLVGFFAGPAYVSGLTVIHHEADSEFRGRSFAALLSLTRLAMMIALGLSPIVAGVLGGTVARVVSDGVVSVFGLALVVSGTRITLWIGGILVILVGILAGLHFRGEGWIEPKVAADVGEDAVERGLVGLRRKSLPAAGTDPFRPSVEMVGVENENRPVRDTGRSLRDDGASSRASEET